MQADQFIVRSSWLGLITQFRVKLWATFRNMKLHEEYHEQLIGIPRFIKALFAAKPAQWIVYEGLQLDDSELCIKDLDRNYSAQIPFDASIPPGCF